MKINWKEFALFFILFLIVFSAYDFIASFFTFAGAWASWVAMIVTVFIFYYAWKWLSKKRLGV
ncbi:hypothetical protein DRO69_00450 [Candidatus Bathyarchaeota archaeon]|nr:MAG: hypothetical protein DRO69_00450 [Candidatus Bathyarchaeota archaeon]